MSLELDDFMDITCNPILQVSIGFISILTVLLLIYVLYQGLLYCSGHNSQIKNYNHAQKWTFFKILFVKKMEMINKNTKK